MRVWTKLMRCVVVPLILVLWNVFGNFVRISTFWKWPFSLTSRSQMYTGRTLPSSKYLWWYWYFRSWSMVCLKTFLHISVKWHPIIEVIEQKCNHFLYVSQWYEFEKFIQWFCFWILNFNMVVDYSPIWASFVLQHFNLNDEY